MQSTPLRTESMDLGFGVQLKWQGDSGVPNLFTSTVSVWSQTLRGATA